MSELRELMQASTDSTRSAEVVRKLRAYLAGKPDSQYVALAHIMIVQALVSGHAPTTTVIADAERAIPYLPDRPEARAPFYFTVANYLAEHGGPLDTALLYANRALSEAPDGENYRGLKSLSRLVLGRVQMERGQYADAVELYRSALTGQFVADPALLVGIARAQFALLDPRGQGVGFDFVKQAPERGLVAARGGAALVSVVAFLVFAPLRRDVREAHAAVARLRIVPTNRPCANRSPARSSHPRRHHHRH